jgi:Rrf2 family protein
MRQLRHTSEYAIRALTYLALSKQRGFVHTQRIAHDLGLPPHYLAKLLKPLVDDGLLQSRRGRTGGFRLNRAPSAITLEQIVSVHEQIGPSTTCLLGVPDCGAADACPLRSLDERLHTGLLAVLRSTTLADLERFCNEQPCSRYPSGGPHGPPIGTDM